MTRLSYIKSGGMRKVSLVGAFLDAERETEREACKRCPVGNTAQHAPWCLRYYFKSSSPFATGLQSYTSTVTDG